MERSMNELAAEAAVSAAAAARAASPVEECKQVDETIFDKMSEEEQKKVMACQKKGSFEDLLLKTQFLDFNWQSKPAKNIDTVYTYDDVIGRPASVGKAYPFQELKADDTKNPNNRAAQSVYIKTDATETKRDYFDVLLKCKKDAKGLSPEEYLREQEALIKYLKMIIEDYMKNIVLAIDYKKDSLRLSRPLPKNTKTNPEAEKHKAYQDSAEEFRKQYAIRSEAISSFESYSNIYYNAYKRKSEIAPEIERLTADITRLNALVKSGAGIKTPSLEEYKTLFISKLKGLFSKSPTNAELLESSKAELKEYQEEEVFLNKDTKEAQLEVRTGLNKIPVDIKLSVDMKKVLYSLNSDVFSVPTEKETNPATNQKGGASASKKGSPKNKTPTKETPAVLEPPYEKLVLKPGPRRALIKEEIDKLEEDSQKKYKIYEEVFLENEEYGVQQVNTFITGANLKYSTYKTVLLNKLSIGANAKEILEIQRKIDKSTDDMEQAKLGAKLNSLVLKSVVLEKTNTEGKLINSQDTASNSHILNSLLAVPESMPLEGLFDPSSEEDYIRGGSIENKMVVADIQGFIKNIDI